MAKKPKVFAKDHHWVGSGSCENAGKDERLLIDNADKVEVLSEASDPNQDWSYDYTAICKLVGQGYFLVQTSGCSCPSPSETWSVVKRFKTKKQVLKAIEDGEYQGYTFPSYVVEDFKKDLSPKE